MDAPAGPRKRRPPLSQRSDASQGSQGMPPVPPMRRHGPMDFFLSQPSQSQTADDTTAVMPPPPTRPPGSQMSDALPLERRDSVRARRPLSRPAPCLTLLGASGGDYAGLIQVDIVGVSNALSFSQGGSQASTRMRFARSLSITSQGTSFSQESVDFSTPKDQAVAVDTRAVPDAPEARAKRARADSGFSVSDLKRAVNGIDGSGPGMGASRAAGAPSSQASVTYTKLHSVPVNPFLPPDTAALGESRKRKGRKITTFRGHEVSRYLTEFEEVQAVGEGAFSKVFKCCHRHDGCVYAVKQISRESYGVRDRAAALGEVFALAALAGSRHIVRYHGMWWEDSSLYIQTEFCDGSAEDLSLGRVRLDNEEKDAGLSRVGSTGAPPGGDEWKDDDEVDEARDSSVPAAPMLNRRRRSSRDFVESKADEDDEMRDTQGSGVAGVLFGGGDSDDDRRSGDGSDGEEDGDDCLESYGSLDYSSAAASAPRSFLRRCDTDDSEKGGDDEAPARPGVVSMSAPFPAYQRALPESLLRKMSVHISRALVAVHSRGMAHLDIKPGNILFVRSPEEAADGLGDGTPAVVFKLGDFGLARRADVFDTEVLEGDARYLCPALLGGDTHHLQQADMYSLGASLYELARGQNLSLVKDWHRHIFEHRQEDRAEKLAAEMPGVSAELVDVILALLDPDPEKRPVAAEVVSRLTRKDPSGAGGSDSGGNTSDASLEVDKGSKTPSVVRSAPLLGAGAGAALPIASPASITTGLLSPQQLSQMSVGSDACLAPTTLEAALEQLHRMREEVDRLRGQLIRGGSGTPTPLTPAQKWSQGSILSPRPLVGAVSAGAAPPARTASGLQSFFRPKDASKNGFVYALRK